MIKWWKAPSGYGAYGQVPNGTLVCAVLWTVAAFPFALTYLVSLEVCEQLQRRLCGVDHEQQP